MTTHPEFSVEDRTEQPYVGATAKVTMQNFAPVADRLPVIFGWLAERGIDPAGPPFLRYRVIDMERELVVQAGVPLAAELTSAGDWETDRLPAGRYVTTTYPGHPDDLIAITADLLRWADDQGLVFAMHPSAEGEVWDTRLEILETNPVEVPDPSRWRTTLAFRLVDER